MAMHKMVLGLACLCCMAHGSRVKKASTDAGLQQQSKAIDFVESTQSVDKVGQESNRINARSDAAPLSKLALLLLASDPAAAAAAAAAFRPVPGLLRPAVSSKTNARSVVPAMSMNTNAHRMWGEQHFRAPPMSMKDDSLFDGVDVPSDVNTQDKVAQQEEVPAAASRNGIAPRVGAMSRRETLLAMATSAMGLVAGEFVLTAATKAVGVVATTGVGGEAVDAIYERVIAFGTKYKGTKQSAVASEELAAWIATQKVAATPEIKAWLAAQQELRALQKTATVATAAAAAAAKTARATAATAAAEAADGLVATTVAAAVVEGAVDTAAVDLAAAAVVATAAAVNDMTAVNSDYDAEFEEVAEGLTPDEEAVVKRPRKVTEVDSKARIPVWPAWTGLAYTILDFLGLKELAAKAEDKFGGRVCPMSFDPGTGKADPFILMVHHRHSFNRLDPLRPLFRFVIPEGFPAHQHRGFETVTYVLPDMRGLTHRDSMGLKMEYGDGECQWMTAGSGMLHEEMWSNDLTNSSIEAQRELNFNAELYQIWLNLPSRDKMTQPRVQLLRPTHKISETVPAPPEEVSEIELPTANPTPGVTVRVLAGRVGSISSKVETFSDVIIMHTTLAPGSTWSLPLPPDFTAMVYVRKGNSLHSSETPISVHQLAFFERYEEVGVYGGPSLLPDGVRLTNSAEDASDVADVLLLAGNPLREPVAAAGPFVMNTQTELKQAFADLKTGPWSKPWDHKLSDEEWRAHLAAYQEDAQP